MLLIYNYYIYIYIVSSPSLSVEKNANSHTLMANFFMQSSNVMVVEEFLKAIH
jgi:hypothetical protein